MQRPSNSITSILLLFFCTTLAFAQQEPWKKIRDKEGVEVFTRSGENSGFKEFRSRAIVEGDLNAFLAVLYDVEALKDWGYKIMEARLIRRDADSLQVYYAVAKAPFPYKNRDGVYLNRFAWDSDERTLTVEIRLIEEVVPEQEDLVRMKGYGHWKVRELPSDRLDIQFQMQMDPGGNIPPWLSNMFSGDTPYYTMKGMRDALQMEKYRGREYPAIRVSIRLQGSQP